MRKSTFRESVTEAKPESVSQILQDKVSGEEGPSEKHVPRLVMKAGLVGCEATLYH